MKLSIRYKSILAAMAIAAVALPGCKKFLDINESPNSTTTAPPERILPSIELAVGHVVSYQFQNTGNFWSQYWTQSPSASQFRPVDAYTMGPNDFDRPWSILYANALTDTDSLISLRAQPKYQQYSAIAFILRAYSFQLLTDAFGDIPLSEALKSSANRSPKYDAQRAVYDSVYKWIDAGTALINPASKYLPGTEDILGGGGAAGMNTWKAFANTLKLRAMLRLTEVDNARAKTMVEAFIGTNPTFLTKTIKVPWVRVGGNRNPLYEEVIALNLINQVASSTVMDQMKANNDLRMESYFFTDDNDEYTSIPQGGFDAVPSTTPVSQPSSLVLASAAPGILISLSESYFLQAEVAARGWSNGNAKALFESGITASFVEAGLTAADAADYIADPGAAASKFPDAGTVDQKVGAIITAKYFAMTGNQGFESWTEWRRTGYPTFLVKSAASQLGNNNLPARFVYPQAEVNRNSNFPGLKKIDEKVWWDAK